MKLARVAPGIFVNHDMILALYVTPHNDKFKVVAKQVNESTGVLADNFTTVQQAEDWIRRFGKGKVEVNDIENLNMPEKKPVKSNLIVPPHLVGKAN